MYKTKIPKQFLCIQFNYYGFTLKMYHLLNVTIVYTSKCKITQIVTVFISIMLLYRMIKKELQYLHQSQMLLHSINSRSKLQQSISSSSSLVHLITNQDPRIIHLHWWHKLPVCTNFCFLYYVIPIYQSLQQHSLHQVNPMKKTIKKQVFKMTHLKSLMTRLFLNTVKDS